MAEFQVTNVLPAPGKVQELQVASQPQQSLWQDTESKFDSGRREEVTSNRQAPSSERSSKLMEGREYSMRQLVTGQHSASDSSVNLNSKKSNKLSAPPSETNKILSSKQLPQTASLATGDRSTQQTDPSNTITVGSDSEIQESIHSIASA